MNVTLSNTEMKILETRTKGNGKISQQFKN